jgi:hypothetical protein
MTADLDPRTKRRLVRALAIARLVMLWEQGAMIWAPVLLAAGFIAVAGLWGVFEGLPPWAGAALVAVILLAGLGFAVRGVFTLRWPSREETRRRLELDSRLIHQPLTSLEDAPASGDVALWALHRTRAIEAIARTRVGRPRAGLAAADPMALRYLLVVAGALALWGRGIDRAPEAAQAFHPAVRFAETSAHALAAAGGRVFETARDAVAPSTAQSKAATPGRPRIRPPASRP